MRALTRTSLANTAVDTIRREIVAQKWQVGEKLPNEALLSSALSVSRGTVREAVRVLVSQGYLETRQGSGTYVLSTADLGTPMTMAKRAGLRDLFETRLALDVEAARLTALRHTSEDIAAMCRLLAERGDYDGGDMAAFIVRDFAFHKAVVAASRNSAMVEIYQFFSASIAETIEATLGRDLPEPDIHAHAAIIDAVETGDPEKADMAVRRFMAPILSTLDQLLMS